MRRRDAPDGRTDGKTDRRADGLTDRRTDRRADGRYRTVAASEAERSDRGPLLGPPLRFWVRHSAPGSAAPLTGDRSWVRHSAPGAGGGMLLDDWQLRLALGHPVTGR